MKVLKTIALTAAIASVTTTVALAGVHAIAQPDTSRASTPAPQAAPAQVKYTVTLTPKRLTHLAGMLVGQGNAAPRHHQRHHARVTTQFATWHAATGQTASSYRAGNGGGTGAASTGGTRSGGSSGYHCPRNGGSSGSTHHVSGHGDCGDGGSHGGCD
jgi:hypothetical protein